MVEMLKTSVRLASDAQQHVHVARGTIYWVCAFVPWPHERNHDYHYNRWMIHRTGKYKIINMIFGVFPLVGTILMMQITEDSGWLQKWFSIVCSSPQVAGAADLKIADP